MRRSATAREQKAPFLTLSQDKMIQQTSREVNDGSNALLAGCIASNLAPRDHLVGRNAASVGSKLTLSFILDLPYYSAARRKSRLYSSIPNH